MVNAARKFKNVQALLTPVAMGQVRQHGLTEADIFSRNLGMVPRATNFFVNLSSLNVRASQPWRLVFTLVVLAGIASMASAQEPLPSPSTQDAVSPVIPPMAEPAATPEVSPPASDGTENVPLPTTGAVSEPTSAQLFGDSSLPPPDPVEEEKKRRAALLLQVQSTQSATDSFSRSTFQRAQTNAETVFTGIGGVPLALSPIFLSLGSKETTGFRLGPFAINPVLSAGIGYGSTSGNGDRKGTSGFFGTVSPAFTLSLGEPATGRVVSVLYTGALSYGSDSGDHQVYSQSFSASGTFNFVKLNLGVSLDFSQLSGSDRDFGGQNVDREIIGFSLTASYIYSEKTNFSAAVSTPIRLYGSGSSSEGVNITGFINYVYSPLTVVGVGFGLGNLEVEQGDSQYYEQFLGRLTYLINEKFTFSGTFGCEFLDAGSKEQITPVFGLGLVYSVREGTSLSLNAERRILNSASQTGTNYTDTSISASISQRVGNLITTTGTISYENASYTGVARGVSTNRNDNQIVTQGGISYRFRDRWSITGVISYGKNFSGRDGFDSVQSSLQLSYVF